ncbi:hypothetical protein FACS18949_16820 [Clostridia bacterium]|nr:hypothetical protein FACS189425_02380 [Clostridia bacterium]GHV36911.1 hypothetical protein FACS18949_16820 [Clostridia bacterium]
MKKQAAKQVSRKTHKSANGRTYRSAIYEEALTDDSFTKVEQISRIAPYDETEYHWASRQVVGEGTAWQIYRRGILEATLAPDYTVEQVVDKLVEMDEAKKLTRTGGIN